MAFHTLAEPALAAASLALEVAAAIVIVVAAARALVLFLAAQLRRPGVRPAHERQRFARSLLLGLDFAIGADVLAVAVAPTLDRVLLVGLVVVVRSILTLVLEHELRQERSAVAEQGAAGAGETPRSRDARDGRSRA